MTQAGQCHYSRYTALLVVQLAENPEALEVESEWNLISRRRELDTIAGGAVLEQ